MNTITLNASVVKFSVGRERHGLRAPKGGCTVGGKVFKGGQFCLPYDPTNPHGEPAVVAPTRLAIHGFTYEVREIPAGECGTVAYRLEKRETGHVYDVILNHFGEVTCDCPDYVARHENNGTTCKHGRRLVELGMIAPPRHPAPAIVIPNVAPRRRFEPSPEERAEAAQLFGDVQAERFAYRRELATAY